MNLARRILMARRMGDTPDCAPDYDPYWDDVVLLLKGDGPDGSTNITDSSVYGHPVTVHGNAQISTAQSVYPGGSSMYFDGNGASYLDIAKNPMFDLKDDFTIEFWFNKTAYNTTGFCTVLSVGNGNANFIDFRSGQVRVILSSGSLWSRHLAGKDVGGQWHHLALIKNSNTHFCFVDGIQNGSGVSNSSGINLSSIDLRVGKGSNHGMYPFLGYIQDLRITKNRALYTTNFTPPTAPLPDPDPYDYSLFS